MIKNIEIISVIITLILTYLLTYLLIQLLGEYGWGVFVLTPLILGFLPPFITSKVKKITRNKAYKLSFATLGISCLASLIFALEGLICIVMSLPVLALFTLIGSYLAYVLQGKEMANSTNVAMALILSSIGLTSFDVINEPGKLIPVRTEVMVNSTIDEVWNNVVTFNKIEEPVDWIFKTGISYPIDATIEGEGNGAIRYCNFITGSFVEPITKWDEPNLLQFDVKEQPIPMNEFNPFWEVHPPHLDGYFKSYKGQFKLTKIEENKTALEGTTWYKVDITPQIYWKLWSDFIVHRIHKRVLNHIKKEAEKK